jgi:hypothetical protein
MIGRIFIELEFFATFYKNKNKKNASAQAFLSS